MCKQLEKSAFSFTKNHCRTAAVLTYKKTLFCNRVSNLHIKTSCKIYYLLLFYFFNKSLKEMFTFLVHNCRRWPDISFNQTFIKRIIFVVIVFFLFDWYKCFHHAHKFVLNWRNVPRTPLSFSVQIFVIFLLKIIAIKGIYS